jgi:FlaA1/EpsC-like NDP-sugar epimerase
MYICTPCQGQYPAASQLQLPITTIRMGTCYLEPFDRIDIVFTGMRLGEKLFEELNTEAENRNSQFSILNCR